MIASERSDLSDLPSHLDHDAIDCINDVAGGQQREQYDTRGCFEVVPPSPQRRGEPTDCRHVGQAASQVAGLISLTLSGSVESSGQNDPAALPLAFAALVVNWAERLLFDSQEEYALELSTP
jgi:hypothetical protein